MRLFLYYSLHSFINQLRKLFKTWVLLFLVACMVIGGLIGLGAARLENAAHSDDPDYAEAEVLEEEDEPLPGEEEIVSPEEEQRRADRLSTLELIAGGIILAVLVYEALSADKNGGKIFLPADVNILFPSPMTPQSVLMFRLATQLGTAVLASIYLLFQLPNLVLNLGLSVWAALAVIAAWCLTVVLGKLLQVLLYLAGSNHPGLKRNLRYAVYGLLALAAAGYFLFWQRSGESPLAAARLFFNAPLTRYIPLWGWLKGFCLFAIEGSAPGTLACLGPLLLGGALLVWAIRRSHADFYEDAMARSEETAELLERAKSEKSSGIVVARRKKDRSETLRRDGMTRGAGASVFFYKALYNRFRFAHMGFLTKTTETYLVAAVGVAALCRFVLRTNGLIPVVLTLAGLAFFRSLGNPLAQDTKMDFFRLIPESPWKKLFWSLLGGTANCLLDLLPGLILAVILLGANVLEALCWVPFILSIDIYATCVGTFIDLSVPVAAGKTVKQLVQILFIYFGLLPDIAIMAVGLVLDHTAAAALGAAAVNLLLGAVFFALCPLCLEPGSRRTGREDTVQLVDIKSARRSFSRMGAAAVTVLAVGAALQLATLFSLPATAALPDGVLFALTFAPLYLAAFPLGWLILRRMPAAAPERRSMGAGAYVSAFLISIFMMYAGNLVGTVVNSALASLVRSPTVNPLTSYALSDSLGLKLLFLVVLAPLWEEFFFRRLLIDRMRVYGERLAVVTSAVMFGFFHGNLSQLFYAVALGLVFGYVYLHTGRLRYSLGLHMFINCLGSVVGPALLKRAGQSAAAASPAAEYLSSLADPGAVIFGAYTAALLALAIAGLVLLLLRARSIRFAPAERELPRGDRFRTVWLNAGMLLFSLLCFAQIVYVIAAPAL